MFVQVASRILGDVCFKPDAMRILQTAAAAAAAERDNSSSSRRAANPHRDVRGASTVAVGNGGATLVHVLVDGRYAYAIFVDTS